MLPMETSVTFIGECANEIIRRNNSGFFNKGKEWGHFRICKGADPGFQIRGGEALKIIAPSGGRCENCWGISCEKSRFYAKKIIFFPILGGGAPGATPLPLDPPLHGLDFHHWHFVNIRYFLPLSFRKRQIFSPTVSS
jgi:hypothetical protein